jgi:alkylhydroperoxidase family enzyme
VGSAHGITAEDVAELGHWQTSSRFSPVERLMLELCERMTATPVEVPEPLFRQLEQALGKAGLVELTANIAWENYRARFNHTFGAESDNFSEGAFCAVPARPSLPPSASA